MLPLRHHLGIDTVFTTTTINITTIRAFPHGADEREKKRIKSINEQTLINNKIRNVLAISVVVLLQTTYPTTHDTLHCTNIKKHIQHINTNENITS